MDRTFIQTLFTTKGKNCLWKVQQENWIQQFDNLLYKCQKQNKTKQNKTKQNKTKQNKKQNKHFLNNKSKIEWQINLNKNLAKKINAIKRNAKLSCPCLALQMTMSARGGTSLSSFLNDLGSLEKQKCLFMFVTFSSSKSGASVKVETSLPLKS